MSAQRLVQKGWYLASAGLPHTGHLAWMRTARSGADRSGGVITHKNRAMSGARQHTPVRRPKKFGRRRVDQIMIARYASIRSRTVRCSSISLIRSRAAVTNSVLVRAGVEPGHHHLGDRTDIQGTLQGLADAFEAQMRIGWHADGGVAGL